MPTSGETVVLVPGLWMIGLEFGVLRHRLQQDHGFDAHVFAYPTMHGDAAQIAADLADFARRKVAGNGPVHLVGHSLGGAIVYRAVTECLGDVAGKAVLLCSPLNGSRAASGAARHAVLRPLLGTHVQNELAQPVWSLLADQRVTSAGRHCRFAPSRYRTVFRAFRRGE
jgi:alpha-beta hydrolase superfamily lysophospholipase